MMKFSSVAKCALALPLVLSLSACSLFASKSVYENSRNGRALEVPPDLSYTQGSAALDIPQIAPSSARFSHSARSAQGNTAVRASASGTATATATGNSAHIRSGQAGVRILRDGAVRWLELDLTPRQVWPKVRDFLARQGLKITQDDPQLGIIETGWREYKAETADGFFSRLLGKLNSTGLRNRYRFRIEPATIAGKTDVYITQQGLREVATADNGLNVIQTAWETRPTDLGLEAEMMQRFLVYLGESKTVAGKMLAATPAQPHARLARRGAMPVLLVDEVFARTWLRAGLALDRMGVRVTDRDRSHGLYFIGLPKDFSSQQGKGWLAGLFGRDKKKAVADRYQLKIVAQGSRCVINVLTSTGVPDKGPVAERILKRLLVNLK